MTPTMKKRGKTVLGVRMGLSNSFSKRFNGGVMWPVGCRGPLTATLSVAAAGRQYL